MRPDSFRLRLYIVYLLTYRKNDDDDDDDDNNNNNNNNNNNCSGCPVFDNLYSPQSGREKRKEENIITTELNLTITIYTLQSVHANQQNEVLQNILSHRR